MSKVQKVLMLQRCNFPGEISKLFFDDQDWRIHNDTAIILDKEYLEPEEGNFAQWLVDNYDLSEVEAIVVDVAW